MNELKKYNILQIQSMLKLIPNGMVIGLDDLIDIFSQNELKQP